jgi:hypothetical protein
MLVSDCGHTFNMCILISSSPDTLTHVNVLWPGLAHTPVCRCDNMCDLVDTNESLKCDHATRGCRNEHTIYCRLFG